MPPANDAPFLDWATWYAEVCQWKVFALVPRGKTPLLPTGVNGATRDLAQIEKWWTEHPRANIGLPAGANGLVIVDFDPRHGGRESYERLIAESGPWPETARVRSGGADNGLHFYFRSDVLYKTRTPLPGMDVRAYGSYVVCPPSLHPDTGRRYVWEALPQP